MSTATQTSTQPNHLPELTVLHRVAAIPMISSSLCTLAEALSNYPLTRQTYNTAKDISNTAYRYTEPLQIRLAPLIERADGYANKAVDAVESRYPYPFRAKPEEVVSLVRERRQSAADYVHGCMNDANKAIEEKIKAPAYNVAQGIDHQFAPIVDYFEVAVTRLSTENGSSTPPAAQEAKFQFQRALALSKTLKDNLYVYSNEQLKQLQQQSALVQKAMETAHAITNLASSSLHTAQNRIHGLSDTMLMELHKLQASTASLSSSLQTSASTTLHESTSQIQAKIPPQIQQAYHDIATQLSSAASELSSIIKTKDIALPEKVSRVGKEVHERISPLLETVRKSISEMLARGKSEASEMTHLELSAHSGSNGHRKM
ncbi:hypothetical protein AMATHDRAFT_7168 [Amanita thiersii Skay4041]|uniref:Lipid droplet-associated perilipin protein n=1 Tax=Amanita thiersii Skay4041 TaxID=703135 RepID=A0A2A9NH84_9AGAR|nr:hypothetical protein AMATHDRAFT_7168 [Amanita thiersii Skay4041]